MTVRILHRAYFVTQQRPKVQRPNVLHRTCSTQTRYSFCAQQTCARCSQWISRIQYSTEPLEKKLINSRQKNCTDWKKDLSKNTRMHAAHSKNYDVTESQASVSTHEMLCLSERKEITATSTVHWRNCMRTWTGAFKLCCGKKTRLFVCTHNSKFAVFRGRVDYEMMELSAHMAWSHRSYITTDDIYLQLPRTYLQTCTL